VHDAGDAPDSLDSGAPCDRGDSGDFNRELPAELFERAVELLTGLAAISSPSGDGAGLEAAAQILAEALEQRGLRSEVRFEQAAGESGGTAPAPLPVLYARSGSGAWPAAGALLLLGHRDTVLPAVPPRRQGDKLLGTGTVDMKGGLAALAGALDLLAHRGAGPPPDLLLVAVPDEEVGGELSRAAVRRWGASARALWVLEPGEPVGEGGAETLVAGRRGKFDWRLEVRGRAAHAGVHYWRGRSALSAAARWCVEAQALSRPGSGPTVNAGRLVAGDAEFVGNLASEHVLLGGDRRLNVVPDRALAEGETRFLRPGEGAELAHRLAEIAAAVGAATETEIVFTPGPPIPAVDPGGPQRARCERAVALAARRGWRLEIEEARGGISFANFLPDPGRLPVLDGLGPVGGGMHTRDEFVDLVSLRRRIVLLADLLQEDADARRRES
jgi:glutamate carboxypeptidase